MLPKTSNLNGKKTSYPKLGANAAIIVQKKKNNVIKLVINSLIFVIIDIVRFFLLITLISFVLTGNEKPNIVLILIDDLGLTDIGAFGSEIDTPNMDMLAGEGLIFSNYHTSPECAPSRAMLLTGMDNHNIGIPMIPEVMPRNLRSTPGYEGYLIPEALTLAELLRPHGYKTYMTGKWHLGFGGEETAALPHNRGFTKTFILDATGGDNYSNHSYLPYYAKAPWFKNGKPTKLPEDFYSSRFFIDEMIRYIDEDIEKEGPFFSYISFQAQHIPLQAPKKYTDKYLDLYRDGWVSLREDRKNAAIEKGIFPSEAPIVDSLKKFDVWEDLREEDRAHMVKSAAVFAGMLNAMDYHIGRFIDYLKANDLYDNTIFIITSDNGPEGNDPSDHEAWNQWIGTTNYNTNYETLGEENSYVYIGTEFAQAMASPHHMYKFHMNEGGIKVPLIISGPNIKQGIYSEFSYVTDIASTITDIVSGQIHDQMIGKSLKNILTGNRAPIYSDDEYIGLEVTGNSALFKGRYKIVRNRPPSGDNVWRMFDLKDDPGETKDLSKTYPEIFQDLLSSYDEYVEVNGVVELPEDYFWAAEMQINTIKRRLHEYLPWGLLIIVIGLGVLILYRRK